MPRCTGYTGGMAGAAARGGALLAKHAEEGGFAQAQEVATARDKTREWWKQEKAAPKSKEKWTRQKDMPELERARRGFVQAFEVATARGKTRERPSPKGSRWGERMCHSRSKGRRALLRATLDLFTGVLLLSCLLQHLGASALPACDSIVAPLACRLVLWQWHACPSYLSLLAVRCNGS